MFCVSVISSRQTFTDILNFCCDPDLKRSDQICHRILQLMMLYYQTKFDCKRASSLEYIIETVIFWLYKPSLCGRDTEDCEPIFQQGAQPHENTPPYQVWAIEEISSRQNQTQTGWQMDRWTGGQNDSNIPPPPIPNLYGLCHWKTIS